ncbi:hypothetical protein Glove_97g46 [Diversispora epigaea]|uniref:Uncharacterized protein n=1 Tax=Diversispora epigaea TaxID=1348612 RepID=A0A397JEC7_9GLOM|nr:hypothetical protein Glove_97g46 [Diversispora epigaea]
MGGQTMEFLLWKIYSFQVFRELQLPLINTKSPPGVIKAWKESQQVKEAYKKLSEQKQDSGLTWSGRIIQKTWPNIKKISKEKLAFAISICQFLLNPKNGSIKINDEVVQRLMEKNKTKIERGENFEFEEESFDEQTGEEEEKEEEEEDGEDQRKKEKEKEKERVEEFSREEIEEEENHKENESKNDENNDVQEEEFQNTRVRGANRGRSQGTGEGYKWKNLITKEFKNRSSCFKDYHTCKDNNN